MHLDAAAGSAAGRTYRIVSQQQQQQLQQQQQQQQGRGAAGLCMRFYKAKAIRALSIPEIEREVLQARQSVLQLRLLRRGGLAGKQQLLHARRLLRQLLTIRTEREGNAGTRQQRQQQQQLQQQQRELYLQQATELQQTLRKNMTEEMQQQLQQLQQQLLQQDQEMKAWKQQQQQPLPGVAAAADAAAQHT
ncbi:hypothetical protein, conserved [Eimeria brunetti]|uniref:Ribosomal protein L29 n=1 Tax=Eimeria brunetti TaxID=51314 RepID=U6LEF9_9EIME|nr:hypothetical protein, conserved [Eimeria brunetti]